MSKITIAYATNDKFADLVTVSISSIIANASKTNSYTFYILYTELSNDEIKKIKKLSKDNFLIKFIDISKYIDYSSLYERKEYTYEIYYRLYASKVINEKKILYLDCDTIAIGDVAKLYNEKLHDNIIGAAFDFDYYTNKKKSKYYNSGVLLIDTEKFEKNNVRENCIELFKKSKFKFPDQDALNIVCKDKIKSLNPKYNYQVETGSRERFKKSKKKFKELNEKPIIIHFTSYAKPTCSIFSEYNNLFWEYAKNTPFFDELVEEYCFNSYNVLLNSSMENVYLHNVEQGKIGISRILKTFFLSIKHWAIYKIKNKNKNNK